MYVPQTPFLNSIRMLLSVQGSQEREAAVDGQKSRRPKVVPLAPLTLDLNGGRLEAPCEHSKVIRMRGHESYGGQRYVGAWLQDMARR